MYKRQGLARPPYDTKRKPFLADGISIKGWKLESLPYLCLLYTSSAQSVAGLKDATVFGVVDHHRIGDFETAGPLHYICLLYTSM